MTQKLSFIRKATQRVTGKYESRICLIASGAFFGYFLNAILSTGFLIRVNYFVPIMLTVSILLVLASVFWPMEDMSKRENAVFVFLGVWTTSLFLAGVSFYENIMVWYGLYLQTVAVPELRISVNPTIIVDFFKSLFLSSVFSMLERIAKWEGRKIKI